MRNQVQLIAYADRLGGDLPSLGAVLDGPLAGAFGGVHILPCFTPFDGADAGFDPIDHTTVDPRLGDWGDIRTLAEHRELVIDVIVNHVSANSRQFKDVVARGAQSEYFDMFLTFGSVFPDGATEAQLTEIYRPRPGLPLTPFKFGAQRRLVWTTFTPEQIDIDVDSASGEAYLESILETLAAAHVTTIRLDAVGYAIKTPGTTCFMTPQTFEFIGRLTERARELGLEVLVEVHSYYRRQIEIARHVDRVYDFALPPLILHAAFSGRHQPLADWLAIRPTNAVNVLDTHDGIGVIDVGVDPDTGAPGLLDDSQIHELVESIHEASGGQSREATGAVASNLDLYQVNCSFYDAMGRDDHRYLAARAVQLFAPGVPQIYYVGALAGENDMALLAASGVGRDINRHVYSAAEVDAALKRPVVAALLDLCRWRNTCPAFDGEFSLGGDVSGTVTGRGRESVAEDADATEPLTLTWVNGASHAELVVNVHTGHARLAWTDADGHTRETTDLLSSPPSR